MALNLQHLVVRKHVQLIEPVLGCVACVIVPTLVRLALMPTLGTALPFATYFPAVLLATLLWGLAWGTAALIVSGIVAASLFGSVAPVALSNEKAVVALALFLFTGALILVTGETLRRALVGLQAAREADATRKNELQHRLKNTLAIVQSFSFYLSRKTTDTSEFHRRLEVRINALAQASEVLFAEQFEACALPDTAEAALAPFADDQRLLLKGPAIRLCADSCEPLILALHELATNAHKHGALSVPEGRVDLSWRLSTTGPSKCVIRWVEANGPLVQVPVRSGLGQRLLTRQRGLDAVTLDYQPSGLICEITVSVAA